MKALKETKYYVKNFKNREFPGGLLSEKESIKFLEFYYNEMKEPFSINKVATFCFDCFAFVKGRKWKDTHKESSLVRVSEIFGSDVSDTKGKYLEFLDCLKKHNQSHRLDAKQFLVIDKLTNEVDSFRMPWINSGVCKTPPEASIDLTSLVNHDILFSEQSLDNQDVLSKREMPFMDELPNQDPYLNHKSSILSEAYQDYDRMFFDERLFTSPEKEQEMKGCCPLDTPKFIQIHTSSKKLKGVMLNGSFCKSSEKKVFNFSPELRIARIEESQPLKALYVDSSMQCSPEKIAEALILQQDEGVQVISKDTFREEVMASAQDLLQKCVSSENKIELMNNRISLFDSKISTIASMIDTSASATLSLIESNSSVTDSSLKMMAESFTSRLSIIEHALCTLLTRFPKPPPNQILMENQTLQNKKVLFL